MLKRFTIQENAEISYREYVLTCQQINVFP